MATTSAGAMALPGQIELAAPQHVRAALSSLGRTEDVRLSPDRRRLAVACYARNEIAIGDVTLNRTSEGPAIEISELRFHASATIAEPHGVDFLGDDLLAVASRGGVVDVLRLPPVGSEGDMVNVASVQCDLGAAGSVAVRSLTGSEHEVLVVHNWANAVTRYLATADGIVGGEVVTQRWLDLPDGLALSSDARWLAISNHNSHDVLVFAVATMHAGADPVGVLRGVGYPHGLRFALEDRLLLVADAGAPYVHVFERDGDSWATASYPAAGIRVMDDATFERGRHNPQEGGPKGVDIDSDTGVLVITAETVPLGFYDLQSSLEHASRSPGQRLVRLELERLRERESSRAAIAEVEELLDAVLQTKAWRVTAPARKAYGRLRRLTRRVR